MSMAVYVDDLFYPQGKLIFMQDEVNVLREVDESDVELYPWGSQTKRNKGRGCA